MKAFAVALLVGVFLRHGSANWLSDGSSLSAAAWFYILGGAWEFTLCALLLWVVMGYRWTIWRGLCTAALVIGMLEAAQVSVCRLAISDIRAVPVGVSLCDYATGMPMGAVMMSLYVLLICWHFGRAIRERSARRR